MTEEDLMIDGIRASLRECALDGRSGYRQGLCPDQTGHDGPTPASELTPMTSPHLRVRHAGHLA